MKHNIGKIFSGLGTCCSKLLPHYTGIHGVFNNHILCEQRAHFFSDPSSDVAPSMTVWIMKGLTKRLTISLDTTEGRVVWQRAIASACYHHHPQRRTCCGFFMTEAVFCARKRDLNASLLSAKTKHDASSEAGLGRSEIISSQPNS